MAVRKDEHYDQWETMSEEARKLFSEQTSPAVAPCVPELPGRKGCF